MTVRDTSIESFQELISSGTYSTQKAAVRACVEILGPAPRRELARRTGFEISAICGAVNGLIQEGLLMDWRRVDCDVTGKSVHLVELYDPNDLEPEPEPDPPPPVLQRELFA